MQWIHARKLKHSQKRVHWKIHQLSQLSFILSGNTKFNLLNVCTQLEQIISWKGSEQEICFQLRHKRWHRWRKVIFGSSEFQTRGIWLWKDCVPTFFSLTHGMVRSFLRGWEKWSGWWVRGQGRFDESQLQRTEATSYWAERVVALHCFTQSPVTVIWQSSSWCGLPCPWGLWGKVWWITAAKSRSNEFLSRKSGCLVLLHTVPCDGDLTKLMLWPSLPMRIMGEGLMNHSCKEQKQRVTEQKEWLPCTASHCPLWRWSDKAHHVVAFCTCKDYGRKFDESFPAYASFPSPCPLPKVEISLHALKIALYWAKYQSTVAQQTCTLFFLCGPRVDSKKTQQ